MDIKEQEKEDFEKQQLKLLHKQFLYSINTIMDQLYFAEEQVIYLREAMLAHEAFFDLKEDEEENKETDK